MSNVPIETGDEQVGLLVTDGTDVVVSGCAITASGNAVPPGPRRLSHLATLLARHFTDLSTSPPPLVTGPRAIAPAAGLVRGDLLATVRELPVLSTPIRIQPLALPKEGAEWKRWLPAGAWEWARRVAAQDTDPAVLFRRFLKKSTEALRGDGTLPDAFLAELRAGFLKHLSVLPGAASRGIVVAGQIPVTARLEGNRVSGAAIGILVGLSRRATAQDRHDHLLARSVAIADNEVRLPDLRGRPGQRAGILVGNAADLRVEGNTVEIDHQSWDGLPCEAIRAWGEFGRRFLVRSNRAFGHHNGVWVRPLAAPGGSVPSRRNGPWTISDNLCEGAKSPVNVVGPWGHLFRLEENFG